MYVNTLAVCVRFCFNMPRYTSLTVLQKCKFSQVSPVAYHVSLVNSEQFLELPICFLSVSSFLGLPVCCVLNDTNHNLIIFTLLSHYVLCPCEWSTLKTDIYVLNQSRSSLCLSPAAGIWRVMAVLVQLYVKAARLLGRESHNCTS